MANIGCNTSKKTVNGKLNLTKPKKTMHLDASQQKMYSELFRTIGTIENFWNFLEL